MDVKGMDVKGNLSNKLDFHHPMVCIRIPEKRGIKETDKRYIDSLAEIEKMPKGLKKMLCIARMHDHVWWTHIFLSLLFIEMCLVVSFMILSR